MITGLFGNFGIRNSVHNGQTQKTLQIADLLDELRGAPIERFDTSNLLLLSLNYARALIGRDDIGLCLGPKGLCFVAWLHKLMSPLLRREGQTTVVFVVGGWLKELTTHNQAVKLLCEKSKVLVETTGLQKELAEVGVTADVFPNFRDLPLIGLPPAPPLSEGLRLICCGRISRDKGYREAIALTDHLIGNGLKAHLQFYGPVIDADFHEEVAKRAHVSYEGTYDHPRKGFEVMAGHHFIVLPSKYPGECVPGALVEAKFAGVPAIVSDWRFLPEVVRDFQTGFVCGMSSFAQEAADKVAKMTDEAFVDMRLACEREARTVYSTAAARSYLSDRLAEY